MKQLIMLSKNKLTRDRYKIVLIKSMGASGIEPETCRLSG